MKTYAAPRGSEKLVEVACHVCGLRDAKAFMQCKGASFVKCRGCGLVYQNFQPVFDDLKQRYGQNYFEYELENDKNFFNMMKLGLGDIRFEGMPEDCLDNRRCLDNGCATGMLVQYMAEKGWQAEGVELCRPSACFGIEKRGVKIFVGTLEEACLPDESFAVVHFSHLIEHVTDPRAFLMEVRRVLTKRGMALVTTPNVAGFQARLFGSRWRSAIADHLTLFSDRTLARMCREVGFALVRKQTWGGLAKGTAPGFVKKPLDALAKRFGFGDVVLFQALKTAEVG